MTDLSDINPMRWKEVRRRMGIVKEFAAIVRPTPQQRKEFCEAMGLSRSAFDSLIKAWRLSNDVTLLKGRGPDRFQQWSTKRSSQERDAVAALVRSVTDRLGPDARGAAVTREVEQLCSAAGLPAPPVSTTWHMIQAARRAAGIDPRARREIVIGSCRLKLPMETLSGIRFPVVAVAITSPERIVLGVVGGIEKDQASKEAHLLERIAASDMIDRPVRMAADGCSRVAAIGERHGFAITSETSARAAHLVNRLLTNRFGLISVATPRRSAGATEEIAPGSVQNVLDQPDLELALRYAIDRHNAGRQ